jgi:hypothetical protein
VPAPQASPEPSAFLETIILLLMPYFLETATTLAGARVEILRTLASYAAHTRPGFLLAAQVIALGITTLDTLHEARTLEMSVSMRLRYRGNANSLNRAMLQTEKSLQANLADAIAPEPAQTEPTQTEPTQAVEPAPDAEPAAARPQPAARPAVLAPCPAITSPESAAAAVMDALRMMGLAAPPNATPTKAIPTKAIPTKATGANAVPTGHGGPPSRV